MIGYIYKTTNKINQKIYIGKHQSSEYDDKYFGSGKILRRAIEKYGLNNFTNEIAGDTFNVHFTVYAIQSQYGAVKEDSSWTANAPDEFKTFIGL